MYGLSYLGITQLFAASEAPPSLKAIIPEMAYFDVYDFMYPGGIFQYVSIFSWSTGTRRANIRVVMPPGWRDAIQRGAVSRPGRVPDLTCTYVPCAAMGGGPVAPVDDDRDGSLLAAAVSEHLFKGSDVYGTYSNMPFRNSAEPGGSRRQHVERSIYPREAAIEKSGVAIYHVAGWYDGFTRDGVLAYHNLDTPKRLTIGPWFHPETQGYDKAAETLRWFDYWLKDVKNAIMEEDPIHYWLVDAPKGREWRSAKAWPIPEARGTELYFAAGPSGSIRSVNDGLLATAEPSQAGKDDYTIDYTATLGPSNRWTATAGGAPGRVRDYPDLAGNDERALTYTTAPIRSAIEVIGSPVIRLWVSASEPNVDVHAVLEEVGPDGKSDYVSEGRLRASQRKLSRAPYQKLDLPHHSHESDDVSTLPNEPVELAFDLLPIAKLFRAGYRIRVTVTGADANNFATPVTLPAPRLTVHRDVGTASRITLPVVGAAPVP